MILLYYMQDKHICIKVELNDQMIFIQNDLFFKKNDISISKNVLISI
jgi:hypothetical protein